MTQGSDFHTMPGEVRSCVGCHEQNKGIITPVSSGRTPIAAKKPPVKPLMPNWGTNGIIEYESVVQPVLNKYCVKCHSGENPKGRLNLTGDRTSAYSMSYMELTDKMLVHFTPGTGSTHAQPSNDSDGQAPLSRGSVISKLTKYVQDAEHSGENIPFEDQLKIFLWVDSNVPFYSHYRQKSSVDLRENNAKGRLREVWQKSCASCHDKQDLPDMLSGLNEHHVRTHAVENKPGEWGPAPSGMRPRHLNFTNIEHSAALRAPLAKSAGGWGLCSKDGKDVFKDKNDAGYKAIVDIMKSVGNRAEKNKGEVDYKSIVDLIKEKDFTF
jgi:cytochrome c5